MYVITTYYRHPNNLCVHGFLTVILVLVIITKECAHWRTTICSNCAKKTRIKRDMMLFLGGLTPIHTEQMQNIKNAFFDWYGVCLWKNP